MDKKIVVLVAKISNTGEYCPDLDIESPDVCDEVLVDPTPEKYKLWTNQLVELCRQDWQDDQLDDSSNEEEPEFLNTAIPFEVAMSPSVNEELEFVNKKFVVADGLYTVEIQRTEAF